MPIVLPKLPDPDLDETSPYCVIARTKPASHEMHALEPWLGSESGREPTGTHPE
jgi:hypothetical protein